MLLPIQSCLRHQRTRSSFRRICAQPGTVGDRHTTTHIRRPDGKFWIPGYRVCWVKERVNISRGHTQLLPSALERARGKRVDGRGLGLVGLVGQSPHAKQKDIDS